MSYYIVIPARYSSTRLPGKPLSDINGKPLIQHVYERAIASSAKEVIIATDDQRIQATAQKFGADVCMTREDHPSGTDRLAEVVTQLNLKDDEIVVNLQGDEPMMPATVLDQVAAALDNSSVAAISTLCEPIAKVEEVFDPNIVKVVTDHSGHALYFSRAPIPWERDKYTENQSQALIENTFRHIGIYAYRPDFLKTYPQLETCLLEKQESLEQLRALHHGYKIKVDVAKESSGIGVDTPEDLARARLLLK